MERIDHGFFSSNVAWRRAILVVTTSIVIHLGVLVSLLALISASHTAPPPYNPHLYVTLAYGRPGLSGSAVSSPEGSSQESDTHSSKVARDLAPRTAVRGVTTHS